MNDLITWQHFLVFISGSTTFGVIAHAVATYPTPKNVYGQWILGIIKFAVGQRISAVNAVNGLQTEVTGVTDQQKQDLENGSVMRVQKISTGILSPIGTSDKQL